MPKKSTLITVASALAFLAAGAVYANYHFSGKTTAPREAAPVGEEEEGPEKAARIAAYNELIHRAAPGTDWKAIEANNAIEAVAYRQALAAKGAAAFAGGLIDANWFERGNNNTSGRMSSLAYDPKSNTLYSMSDAGTLWKTNPPNGSWTLLNDDFKLRSKTLALLPIPGGNRIMMALDSQLVYSDDNGATIQSAGGITYATSWGGNYVDKIITLNDSPRTVYALVQGWNASPWAARVSLYRSVDSGKNFSRVHLFSNNSVGQVSMFSPLNSKQLYVLSVNSTTDDTLYRVAGNVMNVVSTTTTFPASASQSVLTGLQNGSQLQFYALINDNRIYQSIDSGTNWSQTSTLNPSSWHVLTSSSKVSSNVFYGNVEAYRSITSGASFSKVNNWQDYYPSPATRLHADIQAINFFQDTLGNEFCVIGTDGGVYYSTNYMATVTNISMNGLRVNQLWHHVSHPNDPNILFSGMQDQGLCHTTAAGGTGLVDQVQVISGDYGQMRITLQSDLLWAQYPGGVLYLYSSLAGSPIYQANYNLTGSQKSNGGWLLPTCNVPGYNDDILIGGGNVNGGGGSYIVRLTYNSGTVSATQLPFNFRPASNSGTSGVSAMAISELNRKLWYAATEDGTFFWSSDAGANWNKTASFAGVSGYWLYGASIAPSKKDRGTVYFGGSGYSNPGVYVSRDSGLSFTPMSNGLPQTLVNSLAVSPNDSLIFAATDAGPYVYITAQAQWYPLIASNTPGCVWKTVEYIPSINTARFSTYGRGVWDLVISNMQANKVLAVSQRPALQFYPNPVVSGSTIQVRGLAEKSSEISLHDMNGRTLYTGHWNGAEPIKVPDIPSGVYLYLIRQDDQVYQGKLQVR